MIGVEDLLGEREILLNLRLFIPRYRKEPVEVIAHHSGLRRHRRHLPELLELVRRLLACFLREPGLLNLGLDLGELVAVILVAELFLDRLHMLVEIIFALRLIYLPLDAAPDALLDLEHGYFTLYQAEHL